MIQKKCVEYPDIHNFASKERGNQERVVTSITLPTKMKKKIGVEK